MIELAAKELRPGQVLARTIYRPDGEILLSSGYTLTADVVKKLLALDQSRYWVQEEGLENIIPEELIPEFLLNQISEDLRQNAQFFRKAAKVPELLDLALFDPKLLINNSARFIDTIQASKVLRSARILVKELKRQKQPFLLHFTTQRSQSNFLFQHAVDAAVVAAALGRTYQLEDSKLETLVVGTMLMDIGMCLLPARLSSKPDRLSFAEFCALKEHPTFGFEILRNNPALPLTSAHIAYQHHERQDGGGYPRRLIGTNNPPLRQDMSDKRLIHRLAEIVSVADMYMSLSRPSPSQAAKSPLEVIKFLLRASGTHLNSSIVDTLIPMIPLYSVGSRVEIVAAPTPDLVGCIALVSKTNPTRQDRPEITMVYDAKGSWIKHDVMKLEEHSQITIQEITGR